jgi:8-oxo-dGTP pyrophosphatase MutT (NUDIX family)
MPMSPYYRGLRDKIGHDLLIIPGVAGVLRDEQGRVLLHRNRGGDWGLPAGAVEPGESPAHAIVREVLEETGLCTTAERILGVVGGSGCRLTYPNGDQVEYVCTVFECSRVGGELLVSGEETSMLSWFSVGSMPRLAFPYPDELLLGTGVGAWFAWDNAWSNP